MFFFGLFSTHLPYIILSVIYLMGMGVFSANVIRTKLVENEPEAKVLLINTKSEATFSVKDFHYSFYKRAKSQSEQIALIKVNRTHFVKSEHKETLYNRFNHCYIRSIHFSCFSRPPPSLT